MDVLLEFVRPRGEVISLLLVAALLTAAAPVLASLAGAARREAGDTLWWTGVAFVVGGRLSYLAAESPSSLLDPLVLVRVQGGIEPLAGAAASALALLFLTKNRGVLANLFMVWAGGLALASAGYDLACLLRDACYGAVAAAPLGFPMSGFEEPRAPTPLFEATLLIAVLGAIVLLLPRLRVGVAALLLLAAVASTRLALMPLSVAGWPGVSFEVLLLGTGAAAALGLAFALQSQPEEPGKPT